MKNSIYYVFLFFSFMGFSQGIKIPIGEYKTDKNQPESVTIVLTENNRFQVSIISGTYEQKNDSLVFHSDSEFEPYYLVEYSNPNPNSDQLKLQFISNELYYYQFSTHIGFQETASSSIEYKPFKEFLKLNDDVAFEKDKVIEIPKPYAIYFVKDDSKKGAVVEKYIIPQQTSQAVITFNRESIRKVNLTGYYNKDTKTLSVGEGKKNNINFTLKKDQEIDTRIMPSKTEIVKNWTYPQKQRDDDLYSNPVDSTAVYADTIAQYTFKIKVEKTLTQAQKNAKSQKNRFLVIANNPFDKESQSSFANFVKQYETEIGYNMYEKYDPQYDRFNFYNATEKEVNALKKYGNFALPSVLILNSDGQLLYHYQGAISDENYNYYNSESFYNQLNALNEKLKTDALFLDKKATINDFEQRLLAISKLDVSYSYDEDNMTQEVPEIPAPNTDEVVVDTVATIDYNNNFIIKKNAYKFKTTQEQLNAKWFKMLQQRVSEKELNLTTLDIIFKELSEEGFNRKLFGSNKNATNQTEMIEAKYLIKHYNKIIVTNQNDTVATNYNDYNLNYLIANILDRRINLESNPSKEDQKSAIDLYKQLMILSNSNEQVSRSYLLALKEAEYKDEYLNEYQKYFSSIAKENTNLMEELDNAFELNKEKGIDWQSFKYEYANDANDAAWFVVEKVSDANQIKNAIKWSETSLKIEKNNPYYLDTLGQLYYKNGEREKAIATEQKAIDNIKPEDTDQTENYKAVLEKMKTGTY